MMYLPERQMIVTEVAKAGTHTLRETVKRELGVDQPIAPGHRRVSDIIAHASRFGIHAQRHALEIVCIVREPLDRLASAANHLYGQDGGIDPKRVMEEMSGEKNVYRPTAQYLDVKLPLKLFRFDNMKAALEYIVGKRIDELPHENKSQKRFTASDFDCQRVREFYADDFKLYERAK